MGVCFSVFKKCPEPECGLRAEMRLRGGVTDVDLDDHEKMARTHTPEEMVALFDHIQADGDPFVCDHCGWSRRFHLDTARRVAVAKMLFGDPSEE